MASSQLPSSPSTSGGRDGSIAQRDAEFLLDLLGDEYTQRVLAAISDDALSGSELIDRTGVSKATAYRRLDDLQDAGIVESGMRIDPDGHHCELYQLAVEELAISFGPDGFRVTVEYGEPDAAGDGTNRLLVPADD